MNLAFDRGEWDMAVVAAVHCGISSADALTVYFRGVRHTGQKHEDVVKLLNDIPLDNMKNKVQQLLNLLRLKSSAEYQTTLMTRPNASNAVKEAERFFKWAKETLEDR